LANINLLRKIMKRNRKLIKNVNLINDDKNVLSSIIIEREFIKDIVPNSELIDESNFDIVIDGNNKILIPGIIDTHVHFREPGLTHKGNILSESKAAIAGGITSFIDMPNTLPPTINLYEFENKLKIAEKNSYANYSFYIGASDNNFDEIKSIDFSIIPGIKIFLGSSTGNLKISNTEVLEKFFTLKNINILVHSEDDNIISQNLDYYRSKFSNEEDILPRFHMYIRSEEACFKSTVFAIELAKKHETKLHLLHISTAREIELVEIEKVKNENITSEACIPHIWFSEKDYEFFGNKIKCNPSIKTENDRQKIIYGLKKGIIDTIASDHAPHTIQEKELPYLKAPSGIPSIQFMLLTMLEMVHDKIFSIKEVVKKMAHNPSKLLGIKNRGFIQKGYYADLVLINLNKSFKVEKETILSLCNWSPFEGFTFRSSIEKVFVNGEIIYNDGIFYDIKNSMHLEFNR